VRFCFKGRNDLGEGDEKRRKEGERDWGFID
jgi:hypothetical protein